MIRILGIAAACAAFLACSRTAPAADAKPKFTSKIGMHLIGAYTDGTKKMVRARMPVLKLLDTHGDMMAAARDYKKANPDGVVVLRVFTPVRYTLADEPVKTAETYWRDHIWKSLGALPEADRKLIDYVEATNEVGECPTWENDESIAWFVKFSTRFVELCTKAGFKPCLASIPVGNPGGENAGLAKILKFAPALRAAKKAGGAWAYHNYTIKYTTDPEVEAHYSLRYRFWYAGFTGPYADLKDMPLILTEGGVDDTGNADTSGWQARGTAEKYQQWLRWLDCRLKEDPYVIGVTLFQQGCAAAWGGWKSFDHEPLADWLVQYWNVGSKEPCK